MTLHPSAADEMLRTSDSQDDERHQSQQQSTGADNSNSSSTQPSLDSFLQPSTEAALQAKQRGNQSYAQQKYNEAIEHYTTAITVSPTDDIANLSIYYNNRAAAYLMEKQLEAALKDCNEAAKLNANNVKVFCRRATVHEKLDQLNEALEDYNRVLQLEPQHSQARQHQQRLQPLVAERNEKMKVEMIDKLKGLGNSLLGKFGMSLDNFKAEKDPNSGAYNIQFKPNPK